jgi:hypothetical protein
MDSARAAVGDPRSASGKCSNRSDHTFFWQYLVIPDSTWYKQSITSAKRESIKQDIRS